MYADDSQVRIHETIEGQSGEWHGLGHLDSEETDVNASRDSDGMEYNAKRADDHNGIV